MFEFDPASSSVTMHRGDTGAYWVSLSRSSGVPFASGDVALYTVKSGDSVKLSREYALDDDEGAGNGRFLIAFRNSDTDTWAEGVYSTEIRVVINPVRLNGEVVDGDIVRTIGRSKSTLTINGVLKEV